MKKWLMLLLLVSWSTATWSATYYIDYAGGLNSNNGLSKTAAWKVHPYMTGWNGTYTHRAGDRFLFKGGVTWPYSTLGMTIPSGGSAAAADYYGADSTWYAGNTYAKPIFDGGGAPNEIGTFMWTQAGYITIDGFEMTNFYWAAGGYGTSYIAVGTATYVVVKNCWFHNWSHSAGAADDLQVVLGNAGSPGTGNLIENCIFDGAPNGTSSGMACYHMPTVRNCIARNLSNGFLPGGSGGTLEVSYCEVGPINPSFDAAQHPNSIEQVGGGTIRIHHNYIHHATAVCIFVGNPGNLAYIYNNVIYDNDTQPIPIQFDARGGSGTAYVYNNTIAFNSTTVRNAVGGTWNVTTRNNHIIGGSLSPDTDHNLVQTAGQATTAGYTLANLYRPTAASVPTVDAGSNAVSSVLNDDFLRTARPQGAGWDIGAYEYTGSQVRTANDERRTQEMEIGLPSPLTTAQLRAWLQADRHMVLSDLGGQIIDRNRPARPGVFLLRIGSAVQNIVVVR